MDSSMTAKDCDNCPYLQQRDKLARKVIELKEQLDKIKRQLKIKNRDITYLERKHEAGKALALMIIQPKEQIADDENKVHIGKAVKMAEKVVE